ncbi:putative Alcohol dehydrogenase [Quillaja saponaria]|uniref:Alcohol dehydrogenase n=1 Tax=Quillaja saponaria TaxID=32244 RepID=A0AAD7KQA5_QUISA|nr:putative Alcohol dehydrogenase [Quillaja saponaria]
MWGCRPWSFGCELCRGFWCKCDCHKYITYQEGEALTTLGADSFLVSSDKDQMQAASMLPLIRLLNTQGKLVMVGVPDKPIELPAIPLILGGKSISGSNMGGMKETQEMIDIAAKHNIAADIEVVPMDYVNTAMVRLAKGDVRYQFVIDVGNTLAATKT